MIWYIGYHVGTDCSCCSNGKMQSTIRRGLVVRLAVMLQVHAFATKEDFEMSY